MDEKIKNEIIQKAMLKYRLKSRAVMNTYIISQIDKYDLSVEQQQDLLDSIDFMIDTMKKQKSIDLAEQCKVDIKNINIYYMGKKI